MAALIPDIEDFGSECGCAECASLCVTVPGRLSLADARRLRDRLGGSKELLEHTAFEVVILDGSPRAVLRPRVRGEIVGGGFGEMMPECGPCVFLDRDTGCTLTLATGKPSGCRGVFGCASTSDDANGPINQSILGSWGTPEADEFLEELDAQRGARAPHTVALSAQTEVSNTFGNPYGLLAIAVYTARVQSAGLVEAYRRAQEWGDAHASVVTKEALPPTAFRKVHRESMIRCMKEACAALRGRVTGLSEADRQLVEAGRKRVRIDILTMLHTIDTDMFNTQAMAKDGKFLFIMRSWIETLTRQ